MWLTTVDGKEEKENRWWYHKARIAYDVKRNHGGDIKALKADQSVCWWIHTHMKPKARKKLSVTQREVLSDLLGLEVVDGELMGFQETSWLQWLVHLQKFENDNGHCNVTKDNETVDGLCK